MPIGTWTAAAVLDLLPGTGHASTTLIATGCAAAAPTAYFCAEVLWWRCHRRIIADYLLAAGDDVRHIRGDGAVEPATLTPGAVVEAPDRILYPPAQGSLALG